MNITEGQGVGGHVGDESSPYLCFFSRRSQMVLHNVISVQCSECQRGEKFETSADKRQEKP